MARIFWLCAFILCIVNCKTRNVSDLSHDLDDPTASSSPYFWTAKNETQLIDDLKNWWGIDKPKAIFPVTDPMTIRLQGHIDRLMTVLKSRYPGAFDNIPYPEVRVVASNIDNAYASPEVTSLENVFFNANGKVVPPKRTCSRAVTWNRDRLRVEAADKFISSKASLSFVQAYVNNYNAAGYDCKLELIQAKPDEFVIKAATACNTKNLDETVNLIVTPFNPYLVIFTGHIGENEDFVLDVFNDMRRANGHAQHGHCYKCYCLILNQLTFAPRTKPLILSV